MRKKLPLLIFLHFVLIAQLYSMELICAPNAEVIEQNANLGKSVVEELQNKMQSNTRQLIVPSATDYITAAYNINQQINWAKNNACSYLLQIKLTDTQLKANLMDLKSGEYVFENAYNIKSPNNLSPVLEQLGKTLQHPEFIESETIKKETANTERKSIKQPGISIGYTYLNNIGSALDARYTFLWDKKTIWLEAILNLRIAFNENTYLDPGFRILYPFSNNPNTFYMGGGGGVSWRNEGYSNYYGLFVENSFGYVTWPFSFMPVRIEANATALFHGKKSVGGGLRIIMGITNFDLKKQKEENKETEKIFAKEETSQKQIEDTNKEIYEPVTKEEIYKYYTNIYRYYKHDRSYGFLFPWFRLSLISYYLPGPYGLEDGNEFKGGLFFRFHISDNVIFEPELSFIFRILTINKAIHYDNGYNYYYDSKLEELAIAIPVMLKILPFEGHGFYIEGGAQIEFPFGTSVDVYNTYDSRATVDFGLVLGIGWSFEKSFSIGIRGIKGLTDFDKANGREKPFQLEIGLSF